MTVLSEEEEDFSNESYLYQPKILITTNRINAKDERVKVVLEREAQKEKAIGHLELGLREAILKMVLNT